MSSPARSVSPAGPTVAGHLLACLQAAGVRHVFGVPGDYILRFYEVMAASPVHSIGTTREDTAAFAADGYARCRGLGALAITYGVGALNVVNAVAGAHAESSPVVVISGAPGVDELRAEPLLHHRFGPYRFQREIFERITCATAVLDDPVTAFREIERCLAAAQRERKPVYLELPRDRVDVPGRPLPPADAGEARPASDPAALEEAVAETLALLQAARAPLLIAGVELHRRGLQDSLQRLVERARLPVAATLTGKSVIGERHPAYVGIYEGAMSAEPARFVVEQADLLLMLGGTLNDVDTGIDTARLDPQRLVRAAGGEVTIRHHRYPQVALGDFTAALAGRARPHVGPAPAPLQAPDAAGFPRPGAALGIRRLIARLDAFLGPDWTVVSDVGDCLFAATELRVPARSEFLASAFYTSMGFAVPAALGAQVARPGRRALVLVGDGAFQMTGTELSTHCRLGLAPIVVVFDNAGYGTERYILDGPFNDVQPWAFHRIGQLFGPMDGHEARTEAEFEQALQAAAAQTRQPSLIHVHLSPQDPSPAMRRLGEHLGRRLRPGG